MIFSMQDIPKEYQPKEGKSVDVGLFRTGELVALSIYPVIVKTKSKQPRTLAIKRTIFY